MKTLKLLVAVAMPLALIAGAAHAAPPVAKGPAGKPAVGKPAGKPGAKRGPRVAFGLLKKAEAAKALAAGAVAKLAGLKAAVRDCFKKHGKVAGKNACREARRAFVRNQSETYKAAIAKAAGPLKAALEKSYKWLQNRRAYLKNKAKAGGKAPAGKPAGTK